MSQSWKQSAAYSVHLNSRDDVSVEFSVDPEMYNKLEIKKPKKGEENIGDMEKIYKFQLEKDLQKIIARKGTYKEHHDSYMRVREMDPSYRTIGIPPTLGANGDFNSVIEQTKDHSWQSTSKPYGVIAHKRYLEYLANLPKGPTKDEIQDKMQRNMDIELWEKVLEGRLDPTKRDIRKQKQELLQQQKKLMGEWDENEEIVLDKEQLRKKAFLENNFEQLRRLPTEREFERSMKDWHRGIHYPFNTDKGFPVLVRRKIHNVKNEAKNIAPDSKRPKSAPISSDRFILGNYGQEKQYAEFLAQQNFDKAESYLQRERAREEKKQLREQRRRREQTLRRRRGGHQGVEIAQMVNDAKWAQMQEKYAVNIKVEKVAAQDADGEGNEDVLGADGGIVLHQGESEIYSSSSSSSSSSARSVIREEGDEDYDSDEDEEEDDDDDEQNEDSEGDESNKHEKEVEDDGEEDKSPLKGKIKRKNVKTKKPVISLLAHRKRQRLKAYQEKKREQAYLKQSLFGKLYSSAVDVQYFAGNVYDQIYFPSAQLFGRIFPHSREYRYRQELQLTEKRSKDRHNVGTEDIMQLTTNFSTNNNSNNTWRIKPPSFYVQRMRIRLEEMYEDSTLQKSMNYMKKGFHYYFLDASEIPTATSRFKYESLKKLRQIKHNLHDREFTEGLLNLREDEMGTDALVKFLKRKRKELTMEIHHLESNITDAKNNNLSGAKYQEKIVKLEKRLEYFDLLEQDRLSREKKVKELLVTADQVIQMKEHEIENMRESWLENKYYQALNHIQRMKKSGLAVLDRIEKPKVSVMKLLPPPPKDCTNGNNTPPVLYSTEVKNLLKKRVRERQRDVLLNRRLGWMVGKEAKLEEQEFTLDDLIVACVAGNYREVLDILDPRMTVDEDDLLVLDAEKPSQVTKLINAVNHDHMTPLYAAMMMVLRRQVVEDVMNLEELLLSTFQRLQLRIRNLILQKGDWKHPRFDLVIMILLYYGADLNYPRCEYGADGETILHVASKMGVSDVVEWLLQLGVDCNQLTTRDFRLPLMLAVERNHLNIAMILLRYGAVIAVNHQDRLGNTVMHDAARYANVLLTQVLLISGAMIHTRNNDGKLPTEVAQALNRIEIMTTMQSYRDGSVEHLMRLQFLLSTTKQESATWLLQAMGEDLDGGATQSLSIDTSWDTVHNHGKHGHGPQLMSSSEKRVMKIWKPYLKGAKINPAMAGNNVVNPEDIRTQPTIAENSELDDIEGAIPVSETPSDRNHVTSGAMMSGKTTSSSSDYVTSAPRIRRTVLQLSFAKK